MNGTLGVRMRSKVVCSAPPPPLMLTLVSPLAGPRDLWRSPRTTIKAHPAHEDTDTGVCEINARPQKSHCLLRPPIAPESQCWTQSSQRGCDKNGRFFRKPFALKACTRQPTLRFGGYGGGLANVTRAGVYFANTGTGVFVCWVSFNGCPWASPKVAWPRQG